jgi:receptor protein-tyrosine kinase
VATLTSLLGASDPTLQLLTPAEPPSLPAWPRPKLSIAVAFMAALLLGIGLAVARELGSPRVDREEELLFVQRLPILARVPRVNRTRVLGDLTGRKPVPGAVWEAFRTLRANLAFTEHGGKEFPQTILITSAMPAEGKTFAAVNLATAIAASGQRVVLVDGDLRRPSLSALFGIRAPDAGFVDLVTGDSPVELPLIPAPDIPNLQLVLATPHEAELIDLLEFRRVEHMLNDLKKAADVIIIDSSPLTEVADALTLADAADVVLVAVRLGHTRRDQLNELRRMLERRGAVIAGLVVTTKESPRKRSYYGAAPNLSRLQNMASQEEPPVLLERRRVRKGERNR